jgi:hypothetical protein
MGLPGGYQSARNDWGLLGWDRQQASIRKLKYWEAYTQWVRDLGSVVSNKHPYELMFTTPEGEQPTREWAERELSSRMDGGNPLLYPRVWDKEAAIQDTATWGDNMWQHDTRLFAADAQGRDRIGQGYRVWVHLWEVQRWAWAKDYQGEFNPGLGWEVDEAQGRVAFQKQLYLVAYRQLVGYYQTPSYQPLEAAPVTVADIIEEGGSSPIRGVTDDPFDLDWLQPAPRVTAEPHVVLAPPSAVPDGADDWLAPPVERVDRWLSQLDDVYPVVAVERRVPRVTPPPRQSRPAGGFFPSPVTPQPAPVADDFQRRAAAAVERSRNMRRTPEARSPANPYPPAT